MAQTSSAMREPSMEEILASIRRIIEDSDITRQDQDDLPVNEKRGEVAPFKRPVSVEAVEEQSDYRQKSVSRESGFVVPPLTLQAVLRGTLSDNTASEVTGSHAPHVSPVIPVAPVLPEVPVVVANVAADIFPASTESAIAEPVAIVTEPEPQTVLQAINAAEEVLDNAVPDAENDDHRDYPAGNKYFSQQSQAAPEKNEPVHEHRPLISEESGQKVTAAFGSLSDAVRAEHLRLVDAKTEALLRPMLQQWLDNNLPDLVERLVREEIERVVRGGLG